MGAAMKDPCMVGSTASPPTAKAPEGKHPRRFTMPHSLIGRVFPAILGALTLAVSLHAAGPDKKSKPSIVVKGTPLVGFSPARMVLTADLKGGADDYEEFYCPTIEWDWGDDTKSEMKTDCEPYKR